MDGDEEEFWTFSASNDCDNGGFPDVCDVEGRASDEVVQHSSSGEDG